MYATYFTYILAQQPSSHTGTAMLTTGGNVFHSLSCVDESPFRNGSAALENVDDGGKMEALDSPAAATHPYCHIPVSPSLAEATKDQQQTKEIPSIEKDGKINIFTTLALADFPLLPLPASQCCSATHNRNNPKVDFPFTLHPISPQQLYCAGCYPPAREGAPRAEKEKVESNQVIQAATIKQQDRHRTNVREKELARPNIPKKDLWTCAEYSGVPAARVRRISHMWRPFSPSQPCAWTGVFLRYM